MIYCWIREDYVEQDKCCVICKSYDEKTDSCTVEENENA
jgi:hypothetical protein